MHTLIKLQLMVAIGLAVLCIVRAAGQNKERTLVVNGKPVSANVIQREGHFYVDIESVAHALGGNVTLQANHVELSVTSAPPSGGPQPSDSLSREFQRAAVATLGDMRQWVGAISELISTGVPVAGQWPQENRDRVARDLMQASVAASTNADHQALALLQTLHAQLANWAERVIADRTALNGARNVDPNALENDEALAKIAKCGKFLAGMIVQGAFADDASCH